ncbi:hypothetical protein SK128_015016 [Halocaridina rubra]|uniref:Uncharacterized protein n=1 Tax=Halocaridina rubra TaxID=373956 RepID=A0AAN9AF56_HALRR
MAFQYLTKSKTSSSAAFPMFIWGYCISLASWHYRLPVTDTAEGHDMANSALLQLLSSSATSNVGNMYSNSPVPALWHSPINKIDLQDMRQILEHVLRANGTPQQSSQDTHSQQNLENTLHTLKNVTDNGYKHFYPVQSPISFESNAHYLNSYDYAQHPNINGGNYGHISNPHYEAFHSENDITDNPHSSSPVRHQTHTTTQPYIVNINRKNGKSTGETQDLNQQSASYEIQSSKYEEIPITTTAIQYPKHQELNNNIKAGDSVLQSYVTSGLTYQPPTSDAVMKYNKISTLDEHSSQLYQTDIAKTAITPAITSTYSQVFGMAATQPSTEANSRITSTSPTLNLHSLSMKSSSNAISPQEAPLPDESTNSSIEFFYIPLSTTHNTEKTKRTLLTTLPVSHTSGIPPLPQHIPNRNIMPERPFYDYYLSLLEGYLHNATRKHSQTPSYMRYTTDAQNPYEVIESIVTYPDTHTPPRIEDISLAYTTQSPSLPKSSTAPLVLSRNSLQTETSYSYDIQAGSTNSTVYYISDASTTSTEMSQSINNTTQRDNQTRHKTEHTNAINNSPELPTCVSTTINTPAVPSVQDMSTIFSSTESSFSSTSNSLMARPEAVLSSSTESTTAFQSTSSDSTWDDDVSEIHYIPISTSEDTEISHMLSISKLFQLYTTSVPTTQYDISLHYTVSEEPTHNQVDEIQYSSTNRDSEISTTNESEHSLANHKHQYKKPFIPLPIRPVNWQQMPQKYNKLKLNKTEEDSMITVDSPSTQHEMSNNKQYSLELINNKINTISDQEDIQPTNPQYTLTVLSSLQPLSNEKTSHTDNEAQVYNKYSSTSSGADDLHSDLKQHGIGHNQHENVTHDDILTEDAQPMQPFYTVTVLPSAFGIREEVSTQSQNTQPPHRINENIDEVSTTSVMPNMKFNVPEIIYGTLQENKIELLSNTVTERILPAPTRDPSFFTDIVNEEISDNHYHDHLEHRDTSKYGIHEKHVPVLTTMSITPEKDIVFTNVNTSYNYEGLPTNFNKQKNLTNEFIILDGAVKTNTSTKSNEIGADTNIKTQFPDSLVNTNESAGIDTVPITDVTTSIPTTSTEGAVYSATPPEMYWSSLMTHLYKIKSDLTAYKSTKAPPTENEVVFDHPITETSNTKNDIASDAFTTENTEKVTQVPDRILLNIPSNSFTTNLQKYPGNNMNNNKISMPEGLSNTGTVIYEYNQFKSDWGSNNDDVTENTNIQNSYTSYPTTKGMTSITTGVSSQLPQNAQMTNLLRVSDSLSIDDWGPSRTTKTDVSPSTSDQDQIHHTNNRADEINTTYAQNSANLDSTYKLVVRNSLNEGNVVTDNGMDAVKHIHEFSVTKKTTNTDTDSNNKVISQVQESNGEQHYATVLNDISTYNLNDPTKAYYIITQLPSHDYNNDEHSIESYKVNFAHDHWNQNDTESLDGFYSVPIIIGPPVITNVVTSDKNGVVFEANEVIADSVKFFNGITADKVNESKESFHSMTNLNPQTYITNQQDPNRYEEDRVSSNHRHINDTEKPGLLYPVPIVTGTAKNSDKVSAYSTTTTSPTTPIASRALYERINSRLMGFEPQNSVNSEDNISIIKHSSESHQALMPNRLDSSRDNSAKDSALSNRIKIILGNTPLMVRMTDSVLPETKHELPSFPNAMTGD